jgi:CPA2 family monovalent cation:H+ antiporter-2
VIDVRQDELLAVIVVGLVVLVAGVADDVGVSDAIGALLIGLVVSRTSAAERVERLVLPLRDVFAAAFFVVFGLTLDLGDLGGVALPVAIAVVITLLVNLAVGIRTARLFGYNQRAAANLGLTMIGRGEFSLILVTVALSAGLDERLGPFVGLYVLILALLSPLLTGQSRYLARMIPDRLLRRGWRYVREETISTSCTHLDQIRVTATTVDVCPACVELGDEWVELRLCTTCGYVGCCDDSANRHASWHARDTGHPIIQTLQPGESWRYCFVDETLVRAPAGSPAG